jgi:hypothetical protein
VIQAGPELIADHNDFWNDRFLNFTVRFIASQILAPIAKQTSVTDAREPQDEKCPAFATDASVTGLKTSSAEEVDVR